MDLRQLEYFVRVAELSSFTRASIDLDIAQPALSRQIRLLEVEFKQHLFIRTGRGVTLTNAGQLLLEHSRGILHQVARTHEELNRTSGPLTGRVSIGIPPSLMRSLAVPLTSAFRSKLPHASLTMSEGLSVTMQESLSLGRLDIALLYNITPSPDIETAPLADEELFLISPCSKQAPASQNVKLSEIENIPLIVPCRPNSIRMVIESEFAHLGSKPKIALEIDSVSAILSLVADGQGSAVLTRNAVTSLGEAQRFNVRKIVSPILKSKLQIATCIRHPPTAAQQITIEIIKTHIKSWIKS